MCLRFLLTLLAAIAQKAETQPICRDTETLSKECNTWKSSCLPDEGGSLLEQEETVRQFLEAHCAKTCRLCEGSEPSENSWLGWWSKIGSAAVEYLAAAKIFIESNPILSSLLEGDARQLLEMNGFSAEEMQYIFGALNLFAKNRASEDVGKIYKSVRLVMRGSNTGLGLEFGLLLQDHEFNFLEMTKGKGDLIVFDSAKQLQPKECSYSKSKVLKSLTAFFQVKICGAEWLTETLATSLPGGGVRESKVLKQWAKAAEAAPQVSDVEIFMAVFASLFGHLPESVNLHRQAVIAQELRFPLVRGAILDGGTRILLVAPPRVESEVRAVPGLIEGLTGSEDALPSCFHGSDEAACQGVIRSATFILECLFQRDASQNPQCQGLLDKLSPLVDEPFRSLPVTCTRLNWDRLNPELHIMVEDVAAKLTDNAFVLGHVTLSGEVLVHDRGRIRPSRDSCILAWQLRLKRYLKAPLQEFEDLRHLVRNVAIGKAMASQLSKEVREEYALAASLTAIALNPDDQRLKHESLIAFHLGESPQIPTPGLAEEMQAQLLAGNLSTIPLGPLAGDWEDIPVDKTLARVLREETEILCVSYSCIVTGATKRPDVEFLRCMPRQCERLCCQRLETKTATSTGNTTNATGSESRNATNESGNAANDAASNTTEDETANEEYAKYWHEQDQAEAEDEEPEDQRFEEETRREEEHEERYRERQRRDGRRDHHEDTFIPTLSDKIAASSLESTFRVVCPETKPRGRVALDEDELQEIVAKYTDLMQAALDKGAKASEADFFQCLLQHIPLHVCEGLLQNDMDGHGMACIALCSMEKERVHNEAENEDLYMDVLKSLLRRYKPQLSKELCFEKYSLLAMALSTDNMVAMSELLEMARNTTFDLSQRMILNTTMLHWVAFFKQNSFGLQDFGNDTAALVDDIDLRDSFGRSALMVAVSVGNAGLAQELLEEDAETFEKNSFGETAELLMSDERLRRRYRHLSGGSDSDFASRAMDKSARCQKVFARGGCPRAGSLSVSKLRRCYHKLTMATHPDKCSPETRPRCERKTMEINACYQRYGGRAR